MIQEEFQDLEQQALKEQQQALKEQIIRPLREMYGESPEVIAFLEKQFSVETPLNEQDF